MQGSAGLTRHPPPHHVCVHMHKCIHVHESWRVLPGVRQYSPGFGTAKPCGLLRG